MSAQNRGLITILSVFLILLFFVSVYTLTTYPPIHPDEGWYANLAQNWIKTGHAWTTLDAGPFPDGRGQGTTRLGALPTRVSIQLWGLSLQSIRTPSLIAGWILLALIAASGKVLDSWKTGFIAALTLAFNPLFIHGSHLARPEIWVSLLTSGAVCSVLLGWRRQEARWDALAALLTIVSVDVHQNGVVFAVGLVAVYLALYGRNIWRQKQSLTFIGLSAIGAIAFFISTGASTVTQMASAQSSSHSIPLLAMNPFLWVTKEVQRYLVYFGRDEISALLVGAAILVALSRRQKEDQIMLGWLVGSGIAMMLFVSRSFDLYLLPMVAVSMLLIGRAFSHLQKFSPKWTTRGLLLTCFVLLLPQLLVFSAARYDTSKQKEQELRNSIPCQRILGPNYYWLLFSDCDYRSTDLVAHYHQVKGLTLDESMATIQPDYIIIDSIVERDNIRDNVDGIQGMAAYYWMPRSELQQFLDTHTTLVKMMIMPNTGTVRIYRVDH